MSILGSLPKEATQETLDLVKGAYAGAPAPGTVQKSGINLAEGLVGINLEAPSKKLFPVYSPLRNRFARVRAPIGATAVTWRQISAINANNLWAGVAENTRNQFNTTTTATLTASYQTLGHDDYVGFESLWSARGFEDVRATAALNLLYAVMISEEKMLLGGNFTDITAPSAPAGVAIVGGGSLAAGTYTAKVSAVVLRGYEQTADGNDTVVDSDGETDGSAASAGVVIAGPTDRITWTWDARKGAVSYNLYVKKDAGLFRFVSRVDGCKFIQTTQPVAGNTPNLADQTGGATDFDGIIPQIETASGVYYSDQAATPLTSDSAGGIVELDALNKSLWDNYRLGPTMYLVNAQQAKDITKLIGASSNLAYRIVLQDGQRNVTGGIYVSSYLNKFASSFAEGFPQDIPIRIHPFLPAGTLLAVTETLPYPNNQVPNVWEVDVLQEYTQYEWALTQRRYEFGIYLREVLKGYFSRANGAIVCIAAS